MRWTRLGGENEGLVDAAERGALQRAIDEAEAELAAGKGIPHDVVRARLLALGSGR